MKNVNIKPKEKSFFNSELLSILICEDGFCYALWNYEENNIEALVSYSFKDKNNFIFEIKDFLSNNNLLEKQFSKVNIIIATNEATLIPNSLFLQEKIEDIFKFNFELSNSKKILYCELAKTDNNLIFSINLNLYNFFTEIFKNPVFYHSATSFIEINYLENKKTKNRKKTKVYLQIYNDFFEILIIDNELILLYNTYKYKTDNDLLYYIINIFEQLKLSQEDTEICISGFIERNNNAIIMLKKFVRFVYFSATNTAFRYNFKLQDISPHYYYNFLNIFLCE